MANLQLDQNEAAYLLKGTKKIVQYSFSISPF